ncbi:conserved hypothetical protein [Vibrio chagasii]|nr:conserved hypothetical protein [Vibrio chagasii]CAH6905033.1 conserved hypothetical protein [Vibrio chagasii]
MLPPKNNEGNRRVLDKLSIKLEGSILVQCKEKMHIAEVTMCI